MDERHKSTDPTNSVNPKQDKYKENYTKCIIVKIMKTNDKEQNETLHKGGENK